MRPERAAALVSRWARFYTRDLPPAIASRRLEELDADVHDHIAWERESGTADARIATSILSRLVRGVADDFSWRGTQIKASAAISDASGGRMNSHTGIPTAPSPRRPFSVSLLAVLAALGGVGAVLGVLLGALVIHGRDSLDAGDALIVLPGLVLAGVYLAFAYGAWTLKPWGWSLGVVAGVGSIVYMTAVLIAGWADLMLDAPVLAIFGVLVVVVAALGLYLWLRPSVKAAFERA